MNAKRPNFFIVGAPRCGTTAMYEYLRAHPDIFMPARDKEPHYFGSDLVGPRFERFQGQINKYLALFEPAGEARRRGEASIFYLYSKQAAREIHAFDPDARIIIMLRNPVEMLYSLYYLYRFATGYEDLPTFEEALAAEPDRKAGRRIPKDLYVMPEALYYREVASYTGQVQRYFDVFERDQVQVIIFDDFKTDTPGTYRATLEFLGVDPTFQTEFKVIHASRQARSKRLRAILRNPTLVKLGTKIPGIALPVNAFIRWFNFKSAPRQPLDPALREQLQDEFAPEIERLGQLLGRDLSHWTQPETQEADEQT